MHLVLSKLNLVLSKLDVFKLVISWYCTPWYYTDVCVACVFVCVCSDLHHNRIFGLLADTFCEMSELRSL